MFRSTKKGQTITPFIILGIILLGILVFLVSMGPTLVRTATYSVSDVEDAYTNCNQQALIRSLATIGKNGGYYAVPPDRAIPDVGGAYWYLNAPLPLDKARVAREIEQGMMQDVTSDCRDLPGTFSRYGFSINEQPRHMEVSINDDDVTVVVTYPIDVSKKDRTGRIEKVVVSERVKLKEALVLAGEMARLFDSTGGEVFFGSRCAQGTRTQAYQVKDSIVARIGGIGHLSDRTEDYEFVVGLK